jgi:hypothetical protein
MKVHELKFALNESNDNDTVTIAIKLPYSTGGRSPIVNVKTAGSGFDWDTGNFILYPTENLTPNDRDFEKRMREMQDKNDWLEYEKSGLKAEVKRLKANLAQTLGDEK